MHFRVQTDEMNYGLGMVTRAISARPVKPVYDGVLIESNGDGLVLTCTDGEISIKATVSALVEEDVDNPETERFFSLSTLERVGVAAASMARPETN